MLEHFLSNLTLDQALWLVGGGPVLFVLLMTFFGRKKERHLGHSRAFRKYHGNKGVWY